MSHSIYIADDEKNIRDLIKSFLESDGYEVSAFETGDELKAVFDEKPADLVILDIMMPGTDGLTLCRKLREESSVPIIILTAKDSEYDYVQGITIGSDDYLTKPFGIMEFLARVRALLRRAEMKGEVVAAKPAELHLGKIEIDDERHQVKVDGNLVEFTFKEYELLKLLCSKPGIVFDREQLMSKVWGVDGTLESRTIDMHIKTLRKKLGAAGDYIKTVRNVGYKAEIEVTDEGKTEL